MTLLLWIGLVVCVLTVAAVGLTAFGAKRWADRMATLARGLEAARNDGTVKPPHPNDTTHTTRTNSTACPRRCNATSARC